MAKLKEIVIDLADFDDPKITQADNAKHYNWYEGKRLKQVVAEENLEKAIRKAAKSAPVKIHVKIPAGWEQPNHTKVYIQFPCAEGETNISWLVERALHYCGNGTNDQETWQFRANKVSDGIKYTIKVPISRNTETIAEWNIGNQRMITHAELIIKSRDDIGNPNAELHTECIIRVAEWDDGEYWWQKPRSKRYKCAIEDGKFIHKGEHIKAVNEEQVLAELIKA